MSSLWDRALGPHSIQFHAPSLKWIIKIHWKAIIQAYWLFIALTQVSCGRLYPTLSHNDPDYPKFLAQPTQKISLFVFSPSGIMPQVNVRYRVHSTGITCGDFEFEAGVVPIFLDVPITVSQFRTIDQWEAEIYRDALRPGRCGWVIESVNASFKSTNPSQYDSSDIVDGDPPKMVRYSGQNIQVVRQLLLNVQGELKCPGESCDYDDRGYGVQSPADYGHTVPIKPLDSRIFILLDRNQGKKK